MSMPVWVMVQIWILAEINVKLSAPFYLKRIQERPMALVAVHCLHCGSDQVVKRGKTGEGKQRYLCQNQACSHRTFILDYSYRGRLPEVKQEITDMAVNGSGVRDTARVLRISKGTVLSELKKRKAALSRSTERC
jgi:transposase-like protein